MLDDSGQGFFGGENLILTNFSGLNLSVWGSANPSLSVSNWTLIGAMTGTTFGPCPALGDGRCHTINVNPGTSPMFYVAGNINTGPYIGSPVPATILTTSDFVDFNVISTNVSISAAGVLGLLPSPALIQPGSTYAGGQFQLQFSAPTNQGYTVQGSTNLLRLDEYHQRNGHHVTGNVHGSERRQLQQPILPRSFAGRFLMPVQSGVLSGLSNRPTAIGNRVRCGCD